MLLNRHKHIYSTHNEPPHNVCSSTPTYWLQVRKLHTVGGLSCFLDFRLDLCFEALDFVFFEGKRWAKKDSEQEGEDGKFMKQK